MVAARPAKPSWFRPGHWKTIMNFPASRGSAGRIKAIREIEGKVTSQTRFFALSWMPAPEVLLSTVRGPWPIENALHWPLRFP